MFVFYFGTIRGTHSHPRRLRLRLLLVVRIDASQHRLMRDDQDVLRALQLHDDRLEADDDVAVRLTPAVAVVVLVLIARSKVLGVLLLDLGVCEAVADAGVELVECFPLQLVVVRGQMGAGGDCAAQGGRPDRERAAVLQVC